MSLWDVRASAWGQVLGEATSETLGTISLDVIRGSLDFFLPSFEGVFAPETVEFVRSVLGSARPSGVDEAEADAVSTRMYALTDADPAIGTASLAAAVSLFYDCAARSFDVNSTLEIMSSCYEAVLHTEGLSQDVLESGTDSDNCSRFVDLQWAVVVRNIPAA